MPLRIARDSTAPGRESGLLAPPGTLTSAPSWFARLLRNVRLPGSTQASDRVTVEPTLAPAAVSVATVSLTTPPSAPGATTTATVLPVRLPPTTVGTTASAQVSRAAMPRCAVVISPRRSVLSCRSWVSSRVSVVPRSSFSGPAPSTIPTARARKMETMETRW